MQLILNNGPYGLNSMVFLTGSDVVSILENERLVWGGSQSIRYISQAYRHGLETSLQMEVAIAKGFSYHSLLYIV